MTSTKTLIVPKRLSDLLKEGRAILAQQEENDSRTKQDLRDKKQASWTALREQALADLGELASCLPAAPPDDFDMFGTSMLTFKPCGNVELFVRYEGPQWEMLGRFPYSESYHRSKPINVVTEYQPKWGDPNGGDDEPPCWHPFPIAYWETDSISEAVALCERAEITYAECLTECLKRESPARKQNVSKPLELSDAEQQLIVALRKMTEHEPE